MHVSRGTVDADTKSTGTSRVPDHGNEDLPTATKWHSDVGSCKALSLCANFVQAGEPQVMLQAEVKMKISFLFSSCVFLFFASCSFGARDMQLANGSAGWHTD